MTSRTLFGRALAIALGVAVLAGSAAAQRMNAFEIGVFGGGYFGSQIYQGQRCEPERWRRHRTVCSTLRRIGSSAGGLLSLIHI